MCWGKQYVPGAHGRKRLAEEHLIQPEMHLISGAGKASHILWACLENVSGLGLGLVGKVRGPCRPGSRMEAGLKMGLERGRGGAREPSAQGGVERAD